MPLLLQMGEIRGAGSKGLIEVSVEEGFKDKVSIQKLFADLADYYSNDSAFLGVSISNYDTYTCLPLKADPEKKEVSNTRITSDYPDCPNCRIPGFQCTLGIYCILGAFALLKVKEKVKKSRRKRINLLFAENSVIFFSIFSPSFFSCNSILLFLLSFFLLFLFLFF